MGNLTGYILMLLGLAIIAVKLLKTNVPIISQANILLTTIVGIILILAGALFSKQRKEHAGEEVPIYKGKKIVGYRKVR